MANVTFKKNNTFNNLNGNTNLDNTNISGKTNIPTKFLSYSGSTTDTAETIVNNETKTISVNVLKATTDTISDIELTQEDNSIRLIATNSSGEVLSESVIQAVDNKQMIYAEYDEENTCLNLNKINFTITNS